MLKLSIVVSLLLGMLSVSASADVSPSRLSSKVQLLEQLIFANASRITPYQRQMVFDQLDAAEKTILIGTPAQPSMPYPHPHLRRCENESPAVMQSAFRKIKDAAYSGSGLNYNDQESVQFAGHWVKTHTCEQADVYVSTLKALRDFGYSGSGLNLNDKEAAQFAVSNVERLCGTVDQLKSEYQELYRFAYSGSGMNLGDRDARDYALNKVKTKYFSCR